MPIDKPIEVRAVVSFSDKTVTDAKAENDRNHTTQESIKHAAWAAVVAASVYALITIGMWCQMIKQSQLSQQQLALLRDADRPWVSLEVSVSSPLTFDTTTGLRVEFKFVPSNIGHSPAQNISIVPRLIPSSMGSDLREKQRAICDTRAKSEDGSLRYMLFPDGHYDQRIGLQLSVAELDAQWSKFELSQGPIPIIPLTLVGCVDYTYESSPRHHQTGFALDLRMKDQSIILKSKTPGRYRVPYPD